MAPELLVVTLLNDFGIIFLETPINLWRRSMQKQHHIKIEVLNENISSEQLVIFKGMIAKEQLKSKVFANNVCEVKTKRN